MRLQLRVSWKSITNYTLKSKILLNLCLKMSKKLTINLKQQSIKSNCIKLTKYYTKILIIV